MTTTSIAPTISIGPATQAGAQRAPAQPLWRFALVGLGPLLAMATFALLSELARRVS